MKEFIPVALVSDDSCHEYLIPQELVEEFYDWCDEDPDMDDFDESKYNEYRVDSNIPQLYIQRITP